MLQEQGQAEKRKEVSEKTAKDVTIEKQVKADAGVDRNHWQHLPYATRPTGMHGKAAAHAYAC